MVQRLTRFLIVFVVALAMFIQITALATGASDETSAQTTDTLYLYDESIQSWSPFSIPEGIPGIDTIVPTDGIDELLSLKENGYQFIGRYLGPEEWWKSLSKEEAELICSAGLKILTIYQCGSRDPADGESGGIRDGKLAYECAKALDMPANGIIYFAMDGIAPGNAMDDVEAYLRAARTQTGEYEIGIYGPYDVIEAMYERGACTGFWQCVGWSMGKISEHYNVYQVACDLRVRGSVGLIDVNTCRDMDRAGMWSYEAEKTDEPGTYTVEEIIAKLMTTGAADFLYSQRFPCEISEILNIKTPD